MKNSILLLCTSFLFLSCSVTKNEKIDFTKPKIQIPKQTQIPRTNKGSLYSMQGASLFADKKDLQIGDIIQINIDEGLKSDSKNKRELTENRSNSLGGGVLGATNGATLGSGAKRFVGKANNTLGLNFNSTSRSSDKGEVKTQFDESFKTTISAIIEETYQNGNYYIKGSKELLIDGQKQKIIISGVIRPYDISSENSIASSQIANLKVLYDKQGEEGDVLETPWGSKLLKAIWPF